MKKTNLFMMIAIIAIINLTSCNNDDDSPTTNQENALLANEQNATEENKVSTSSLKSGIEIEGASNEIGAPPAPNSNLDFQLNTDLQEAFQNSGFRIEFSSTESISGAYIKFKDKDNNPTDNYFDVSNSLFSKARNSKKIKNSNKQISNFKITEEYDNTIEVDFGQNIPAGQFCYDICLYDASNNISQIQTVCITVEAWGGNSEIAGEWVFDREESTDNENSEATINCTNGQTITAEYDQSIKDEWIFALNEDGSYYEIYDNEWQELDFSTSEANCSAVYSETEQENSKYSGNWAYNEDDQTLTVIDFKYENLLDLSDNDTYEDGELYYEGVDVQIVSGQLVLIEIDDDYTYKYYFNRK